MAPAQILIGKRYYRNHKGFAVKEVLSFGTKHDKTMVTYKFIFGVKRLLGTTQTTTLKSFAKWSNGCCDLLPSQNYEDFLGAIIQPTFLVRDTKGNDVYRCSGVCAKRYLKKGFAIQLDSETLQLTSDIPLVKIGECFPNYLTNPYFMAAKNTHCVVCGKTKQLTRHHVVPQRYKKYLPLEARQRISNILFVCRPCHDIYEIKSEIFDARIADIQNPLQKIRLWEKHFRAVMKPNHIPRGWHLLMAVAI